MTTISFGDAHATKRLMAPSKLPSPIAELLEALRRRDRPALLAVFANDAVISDMEGAYRGGGICEWRDRLFQSGMTVQPINAVRRNNATVLTVITSSVDGDGVLRVTQFDWTLSVSNEKVSTLTITRSVLPELPAPVASYVLATNTFDLQKLLETFADDAIVNDQLREYRGKAEIRDWADRDIIGNRMTMYVVSVLERHCTAIVAANVDGEFDKQGLPDPLVLSFYFTIHGEKIVQLIILRNEPDI